MSALAVFAAFGGCEHLEEAINNRPTRKSATSPSATTDVNTYNQAVAAMKALPSSDPRSWNAQAQIHQNFCPHGNWFFLPWHRAYLFYFEQICRELTGVQDFALPYWNWQADRSIPSPFFSAALNHSPRSAGPTSQANLSYIGPSVIQGIMDLTNFEQFASYSSTALRGGVGGGYGEVEATPHNNIHGFVGGTMSTFMSPLDPVFWCHHNMIDYMWDRWNNDRGNLNTSDTAWTQFNLTGMFVDGTGAPAEMTCGLTVVLPLLSYQFEDSPLGVGLMLTRALSEAELRRGGNIRHQVRREVSVAQQIVLAPRSPANLRVSLEPAAVDRMMATDETAERQLIQLSGVRTPANDDTYIRVFVNLPGASEATSIDDPHYAGSFGFFTCGTEEIRCGGPTTPDFYVDVTETLRNLRQQGLMATDRSVQLTLVPVAHQTGARRPPSINIGKVSLLSTPAAVPGK